MKKMLPLIIALGLVAMPRWYGKTRHGKYMSEEDAISEGDHAAPGKSK